MGRESKRAGSSRAKLLKLREKFEKLPDVTPILIPMTERDMKVV
jgi:hypothetical protein